MMTTVSIRLAVSNKLLLLWQTQTTNVRLKPHILQEQHIYNFALKLASTAYEIVLDGDE